MNHTMAVMGSSVDMKWPTPQEWFDYWLAWLAANLPT